MKADIARYRAITAEILIARAETTTDLSEDDLNVISDEELVAIRLRDGMQFRDEILRLFELYGADLDRFYEKLGLDTRKKRAVFWASNPWLGDGSFDEAVAEAL